VEVKQQPEIMDTEGTLEWVLHRQSDQVQVQILREVIQGLHKAMLKWELERILRM